MAAPQLTQLRKTARVIIACCTALIASTSAPAALAHESSPRNLSQEIHAGPAWSVAKVSPPLNQPGVPNAVAHAPDLRLPQGAIITRVHVQRDHAGPALVKTDVCGGHPTRCTPLTGRTLQTHTFDGLPADQPIYLVHEIIDWQGGTPPLYMKSHVTVWFTEPATPSAR